MINDCITVIGSGATALAAASYLTLRGRRVILCDTEQRERLRDITEAGGITLEGVMGNAGPVRPYRVTSDFSYALKASSRILVCVRADRHREIAGLCGPHAVPGQTYAISPGNLGSVIFHGVFKQMGKQDITVAELAGNICPCRIMGKARVLIALPMAVKKIAAFPAKKTQEAIRAFEGMFDFQPAKNIFECALNSPNLVMHLAGTLLNTAAIEKMGQDFSLYTDGLSPSLLKCAEAVEMERNQVLDTLGCGVYTSTVSKMHHMMDYGNHDELNYFRALKGPASLSDRYISEDASCSMALLVSVAEEYGLEVPVCRALLTIANAVNSYNYYEYGRTLGNMGMAGMTIRELNRYLEHLNTAGS